MKMVTVLSIALILSCSAYAQMGLGKIEDVKEIKKRPLIVILEEEDAKKIKSLLKNPKELNLYKNEIQRVNEALKVAAKYWEFSDSIDFKLRTEVLALQKENNNSYAILSYTRYRSENWHTHFNYSSNTSTSNSYWVRERYSNYSSIISYLYIELIEEFESSRPIYFQTLPNLFPTTGDLVFGIQMIENYLIGRISGETKEELLEEIKISANALKTKTLLIDKENLTKYLTESNITEYYPYSYQVTDYSKIEEAILKKDTTIAYIQIVPVAGANAFFHMVVDAEKGIMIGYSSGANGVGSKDFKSYTKFVNK